MKKTDHNDPFFTCNNGHYLYIVKKNTPHNSDSVNT